MNSKRITLVLAGSIVLVAAGYSISLIDVATRAEEARALATSSAELADLNDELFERDSEIARLKAEVERLEREAELERPQLRSAAAPALQTPEPLQGIEGVSIDSPAAADASGLRNLAPQVLGDLTNEELAFLRELDLQGKDITDEDLAALAQLANLRELNLRGTAITDAGLEHLSQLAKLRSLELRGTQVTGAGLRYIPSSGLEALHLTDTDVVGDDLVYLPPLPQLKTLKLNRLAFDDADVEFLSSYPNLNHLEVDGTQLTNAGLERLLQLNPQLTRIELRGTNVSGEAIQALQQQYPNCEFVYQHVTRNW